MEHHSADVSSPVDRSAARLTEMFSDPLSRGMCALDAVKDDHASAYWYCARLLEGGVGEPGFSPQQLAMCSSEQGVSGLLIELPAFTQTELVPQRMAIQSVAKQAAAREMVRLVETRRILSLLDDGGIAALVLKGTALAYWLYRDAWHRPRADLDLLVADKAAALKAVEMLRGEGYGLLAGVAPDTSDGFEVALQRGGGIVIDLHWRLLNTAVLARCFSYAELDANAKSLPLLHPGARGLDRLHALFHALLHRITNMAKGDGDRLIWLYDIHLLAEGCGEDDWVEFLRLSGEKCIAALCLDGLRASGKALGTVVPERVEAGLHYLAQKESWQLDGIDQGAVDRSHLAALPWLERIAWLRRKLFPSAEFMRYRYGASGRAELLRAYLARWWMAARQARGRRLS